eukprot:jgi/Botrbrau1/15683/Bobra.4_1s0062.2
MQPSNFSNYVIREFPEHRDKVFSLAWSQDGCTLASGSTIEPYLFWQVEALMSRVWFPHPLISNRKWLSI